ncbi:MAG TPA: methyltransferase domain-containing protein [Candidatus Eisenbacteria bacterium]
MDEPLPFDPASPADVALYDELTLWSALAGELLLEHVTFAGARRVLDLGCGAGFPLLELAERLGRSAFVAGLDPWAEALRRARARVVRWSAGNAAVVRGDGGAMPFRDGAFDLVVSNLGVNNFDDPGAALAECHRVLAPGGILGLSSNLVGHMRELHSAFERVLAAAGDRAALDRLRRHVAYRATVASLGASLASAGLRVTAVREREAVLRFANAEALFAHHFIRFGFRPAWEEIAGPDALAALRAELDRIAAADGGLRLTIPLAYVEARHHVTAGDRGTFRG